MLHRFRQWLFPPASSLQEGLDQERSLRLAAESEAQRLRLDLDQAQQRLAQMEADAQRQGREAAETLQHHLDTQLVELLMPLASPLAQLLTQRHLIEQGKELGAKDLLATSRRLWEGLSPAGVEALETIGTQVPFDPDRHQPLNQAAQLVRGHSVRVRIPGILLKGRVLKTAAVEPIRQDDPSPADASPG